MGTDLNNNDLQSPSGICMATIWIISQKNAEKQLMQPKLDSCKTILQNETPGNRNKIEAYENIREAMLAKLN